MEPELEGDEERRPGAGYATATDLADWLVRTLKLPFREAHHVTGRIVGLAAERERRAGKARRWRRCRRVEPRITDGRLRGARRRALRAQPHQLWRHRARRGAPAGEALAGAAEARIGRNCPSPGARHASAPPGFRYDAPRFRSAAPSSNAVPVGSRVS